MFDKKLKKESEEIKNEIQEKVIGYVGAGLGVIASLAWNEAIKALIEYVFPLKQNTILAKFLYAGAMTLVLIFVTMYLVRIFKKK
jgi:hypothetical protein